VRLEVIYESWPLVAQCERGTTEALAQAGQVRPRVGSSDVV